MCKLEFSRVLASKTPTKNAKKTTKEIKVRKKNQRVDYEDTGLYLVNEAHQQSSEEEDDDEDDALGLTSIFNAVYRLMNGNARSGRRIATRQQPSQMLFVPTR